MPEREPGRPRKLSVETGAKIAEALEAGAFLTDACDYARVSYSRVQEWLKEAREATEPVRSDYPPTRRGTIAYDDECDYISRLRDFAETVNTAAGAAKVISLQAVRKAGDAGQWQAHAWYLERRYPAEYGRRVSELTGPGGAPIAFEERRATVESVLADPAKVAALQAAALDPFRTLTDAGE